MPPGRDSFRDPVETTSSDTFMELTSLDLHYTVH